MQLKLLTAVLVIFIAGAAAGTEYHVDQEKDNSVVFVSDATFEDFEGKTSNIDGYVYWEADQFGPDIDPTKTRFHFEVELATLKTGIGMRDKDMREDFLETDEFPYAVYDGKIISIEKTGEKSYQVTAAGKFKVHGVSQNRNIKADVVFKNGLIHVVSSFQVNLNDHNIDIPKLLFLRVSEVIEVELDYYLKFIK